MLKNTRRYFLKANGTTLAGLVVGLNPLRQMSVFAQDASLTLQTWSVLIEITAELPEQSQ